MATTPADRPARGRFSNQFRPGWATIIVVVVTLLSACGGDNVSQSDRVVEPTVIAAPSGVGADGTQLTLEVVDGGPATGLVMTDHRGRAVYGVTGETSNEFVCIDSCVDVWNPLVPRDAAVAEQLDIEKYGTVTRPDGIEQVTYGSIPLYLWTGDSDIGITGGAGVAGIWFALTEQGGFIAEG